MDIAILSGAVRVHSRPVLRMCLKGLLQRSALRAPVKAVLRRCVPCCLPILSACGIVGFDCTGEYVYGVRVRAFDSESGAPVVEGLAGHLLQSSYAERMEVWENTLMGAGERPGTYSVVVTAPTYEDWVRTGIVVEDEPCHVSVQELRADLVAETGG